MVNTETSILAISVSLHFIVPKYYMAHFFFFCHTATVFSKNNIRKAIVLKEHTCTYKSRFKKQAKFYCKGYQETKLPRNVV